MSISLTSLKLMGTEIEQANLQEMGKLVNDIDRELKIDYEDYVTKYWFDTPYNQKRQQDEGL